LKATLHHPAFLEYAGRFVWLDINIDRTENAAFLASHGLAGIPILYVFDAQGKVRATWAGSANAEQLARFLDDGERAAAGKPIRGPEAAMRRGDELLGQTRPAEAAQAYLEAARQGGRTWKRRPAAIDAATTSLQMAKKYEQCAALALREAPSLPRTRSFVSVTAAGMWCALSGDAAAAWTRRAMPRLERLARRAVAEPSGLVDDRGVLYAGLHQLRRRAGDHAGARKVAEDWLASIESEDRARPDVAPDERASRDGSRLQAAILLGQGGRAVPALEASARRSPDDYSSHMLLASAYESAGRPGDALGEVTRGLALSPGPEGRARLLIVRAAVHVKKRDAAASKAIAEALEATSRIRDQETREALTRRIEALRGQPGG
jgi:thioredoxin-like negative regulator of GroEL